MSLREWQTQLSQVLLLENPAAPADYPALRGISEDRITLYEELLFNTILEALQNIYPYTYRLLSREGEAETQWRERAEAFRRACPNVSYKLMGGIATFPAFLTQQADWMAAYPFLSDLALYEWLEMAALNCPSYPDGQWPELLPEPPEPEHWHAYGPLWNATRHLHTFQFHIPNILECLNHRETPWDTDGYTDPVFLENPVDILIYRDPESLQARFFCLNVLTTTLIHVSSTPGVSYEQAITHLLDETPMLRNVPGDVLRAQAWRLLCLCQENRILTGSIPVRTA